MSTTLEHIRKMTADEGIVWIKGHAISVEVGCHLAWDRFGPELYAYGESIEETIDGLSVKWDRAKRLRDETPVVMKVNS